MHLGDFDEAADVYERLLERFETGTMLSDRPFINPAFLSADPAEAEAILVRADELGVITWEVLEQLAILGLGGVDCVHTR